MRKTKNHFKFLVSINEMSLGVGLKWNRNLHIYDSWDIIWGGVLSVCERDIMAWGLLVLFYFLDMH